MRCMGSITQGMSIPALMSPKGQKGCHDPALATTSMGSTSSNHTLGSLNDHRGEPMLGPDDPVPTYWEN
jgi:hypothetical protein